MRRGVAVSSRSQISVTWIVPLRRSIIFIVCATAAESSRPVKHIIINNLNMRLPLHTHTHTHPTPLFTFCFFISEQSGSSKCIQIESGFMTTRETKKFQIGLLFTRNEFPNACESVKRDLNISAAAFVCVVCFMYYWHLVLR